MKNSFTTKRACVAPTLLQPLHTFPGSTADDMNLKNAKPTLLSKSKHETNLTTEHFQEYKRGFS